MERKTCTKCKQEKDLSDFCARGGKANNSSWCRQCMSEDRVRRYVHTPYVYTSNRKLSQKLYKQRNPEKVKARRTLWNAVARGQIQKPKACSRCSGGGRINGHHHDYSKPLDVEWLCDSCHAVADRELEASK